MDSYKRAKPMRKRKTAIILALALLVSLAGCGGASDAEDVPSSGTVESQTSSEAPETPPESTASSSTPEASQVEEAPEAAAEPSESEEPKEEPKEPTAQSEQTAPASSSAPVSSSVPSSAPVSSSAPVHTHSYTSTVTKQNTCGTDGILTYTCSCGDTYTEVIKAAGNHNYNSTITKQPTCAEEGTMSYACAICGATYTEAIPANENHNWVTEHVDEIGHTESDGTHWAIKNVCPCGLVMIIDPLADDYQSNINAWDRHRIDNSCGGFLQYKVEVPNGDSKWVVDIPAHDETYCTICGATE